MGRLYGMNQQPQMNGGISNRNILPHGDPDEEENDSSLKDFLAPGGMNGLGGLIGPNLTSLASYFLAKKFMK